MREGRAVIFDHYAKKELTSLTCFCFSRLLFNTAAAAVVALTHRR